MQYIRLAMAAALLAAMAPVAVAQNTQEPPAQLGPRAPAKPAPNPFAVATWASLETPQASLIRGPNAAMDLAAREEREYIEVYGRKKGPELGPRRRTDGDSPAWSDVAVPRDLPTSNPTNCSGESYRTIGGQAATGADMIGALGGGRC